MEQLRLLSIGIHVALTQQGIITLARAIDARGLPMLATFFLEDGDRDWRYGACGHQRMPTAREYLHYQQSRAQTMATIVTSSGACWRRRNGQRK